MIIDASVAVSICLGEPDAELFIGVLDEATELQMSAASYVESSIVIDQRRPGAFDTFINALDVSIVSVDQEQAELARHAYREFGKGSGHPARLNFGDCFSYALARCTGRPLLFKGNDFSQTDVMPVEI